MDANFTILCMLIVGIRLVAKYYLIQVSDAKSRLGLLLKISNAYWYVIYIAMLNEVKNPDFGYRSFSKSNQLFPVASLKLVSPGAATNVVTYFFLKKLTFVVSALCKVIDDLFLAVLSSPLPSSDFVYHPAFFLNAATKLVYSGVSVNPPAWCHPGRSAPPVTPLTVSCPLSFW